MRRRAGVSLVEILVVIGIILVLTSLFFVFGAPSREKGRQSACIQQMRQLYMASQMYAIDHDLENTYPELYGLVYVPYDSKPALEPYGAKPDLFYCPSLPITQRKRLYTSYAFTYVGDPNEVTPPGIPTKREMVTKLDKELGPNMNLLLCIVHDEYFYAPREGDETKPPFVIAIRPAGNVYVGRDASRPRMKIFGDRS